MKPGCFYILCVMATALAFPQGTAGQGPPERVPAAGLRRGPHPETRGRELQSDFVAATIAYRESLEKVLTIYNEEFRRLAAKTVERRGLYEKGYISRRELEEGMSELAGAEAKVRETESRILEAKLAVAEAEADKEFLKVPPLATGEYRETPSFIRYNGAALWALADAKKIEKFFLQRFARPLPISALGQTSVHERMGLDHRNALDVALHPDSPEGRALMGYLRQARIPFVAFRNRVSGSATGAHIHVGRPSVRTVSR